MRETDNMQYHSSYIVIVFVITEIGYISLSTKQIPLGDNVRVLFLKTETETKQILKQANNTNKQYQTSKKKPQKPTHVKIKEINKQTLKTVRNSVLTHQAGWQ